MNTRTLISVGLILGLCCVALSSASAGDFVSVLFGPSASPSPIPVADGRVLHINSFTQTGGASTSRATIMASLDGGTATTVLRASRTDISPPDPVNHISIAGPATVTITVPSDATAVFLTYRKEQQPE